MWIAYFRYKFRLIQTLELELERTESTLIHDCFNAVREKMSQLLENYTISVRLSSIRVLLLFWSSSNTIESEAQKKKTVINNPQFFLCALYSKSNDVSLILIMESMSFSNMKATRDATKIKKMDKKNRMKMIRATDHNLINCLIYFYTKHMQ